jgi:hypothetical protein
VAADALRWNKQARATISARNEQVEELFIEFGAFAPQLFHALAHVVGCLAAAAFLDELSAPHCRFRFRFRRWRCGQQPVGHGLHFGLFAPACRRSLKRRGRFRRQRCTQAGDDYPKGNHRDRASDRQAEHRAENPGHAIFGAATGHDYREDNRDQIQRERENPVRGSTSRIVTYRHQMRPTLVAIAECSRSSVRKSATKVLDPKGGKRSAEGYVALVGGRELRAISSATKAETVAALDKKAVSPCRGIPLSRSPAPVVGLKFGP